MTHWAAIAGGILALAGTVILGFDLWQSKQDASEDTRNRLDLDEVNSAVGILVVNLETAFAHSEQRLASYLGMLDLDLKPLWTSLDQSAPDPKRTQSIALRRVTVDELGKHAADLTAGIHTHEALRRITDIQGRIERRFEKQAAMARRMKKVAMWGIILVAFGAVGQLIDVAISK